MVDSKDNKGENKYLVEAVKNDFDSNQSEKTTWIRTDEERKEDQQRYKAQELLGSQQDVLMAVKEALREEMKAKELEHSPNDGVLDSTVEVTEYSVDIPEAQGAQG